MLNFYWMGSLCEVLISWGKKYAFFFFFLPDDMVLVYETRIGVNVKLEICRDALESKSFQLSMD